MRRFEVEERRARIGIRHRLAPPWRADDAVGAAEGVVGLHGTDPVSVYLSAWARIRTPGVDPVDRALHDERALVRVMGMRRTLFVAAPGDAAVIAAACGRAAAAPERRRVLRMLDDAGVPDAAVRLEEAEALVLDALRDGAELTAPQLAARDERLALEIVAGRGTAHAARQRLVSRVLGILAADGVVVRTRPRGTWTGTQFAWSALSAWRPDAAPRLATAEAQAVLARRWLRSFGPATPEDLRWWAGWNAGDTRSALAAAGVVDVDLAGSAGVALADDLEQEAAPEPWAALLPALDPTSMGWKARDFVFGGRECELFDRNGNASPTVWWEGRVVGGWARRADGELAYALLEDVGADAVAAIDAEAGRLRAVIGDARLAPRARARSAVEAALVR